jgi:hypothetical protein
MKVPKNLGMLVLGIWLIVYALTTGFFGIRVDFSHSQGLTACLAHVAGVLLLLGR